MALKKVKEESNKVCGEGLNELNFECLDQLPFLNACLKETLRLYPSAGFTKNVVKEEVELGGYMIPTGTEIACFPYLIQRNEKVSKGDVAISTMWQTKLQRQRY